MSWAERLVTGAVDEIFNFFNLVVDEFSIIQAKKKEIIDVIRPIETKAEEEKLSYDTKCLQGLKEIEKIIWDKTAKEEE